MIIRFFALSLLWPVSACHDSYIHEAPDQGYGHSFINMAFIKKKPCGSINPSWAVLVIYNGVFLFLLSI